MKRLRNVFLLMLIVLAIPGIIFAGQIVDHTSVLTGTVLAQGLAVPGQSVKQGDVIVMVDTIAGPAPAARANVKGTVKEVLVKAGANINVGQIVVRIEAQ
ncbi:MAG: biotin/lipoyl-containing protein [Negativicutes bacterium]